MDRRTAVAALLAACGGVPLVAGAQASKTPAQAIQGYDPVAYFTEGRPVRGRPSIAHDFDGSRYLFATGKNRELFAANPERYLPQFQGLCAAGLADGRIVEADPTAFIVRDGKLYLFQAPRGAQRVEQDPSLLTKARENFRKK